MNTTSCVPCSVCGNTDMALVDGYYYCVECGTQDTNIRETIIEQTVLADGTIGVGTTKKIHTVLKEGIEMSGEWYKWHTFNFILLGLADEVISLGAQPTVKVKVLWIWTRYIKMFQDKDAFGLLSTTLEDTHIDDNNIKLTSKHIEEDYGKGIKRKQLGREIKYVTKSLLLAILYIALNMDKSDIQLYHLLRYVKEKRLSLLHCAKFAPRDLNLKKIPDWIRFINCRKDVNMLLVQRIAIALIKKLDLGPPLVPDLRKLVDNFMIDLCLPGDFKNVVFSLMKLVPCDFLDLGRNFVKWFKRLPEYEVVVMSYVIVGMKMCFGLDCDYELRLSDAVDKINVDENNAKSHKLGMSSDPTERLFSFRDWCKFMQFRKIVLSQNYLPMAREHNMEVDDFVFMEQSEERKKGKIKLSDEVTMNILNKIQLMDEGWVIPKSEFPPTLTPMATYTAVIVQYYQDPELKLLLSEDFTQYSLKYACQDLSLPMKLENNENIVIGVSELNKTISKEIVGILSSKKADLTEVFVRNCENKNWLKTNPPQPEHVITVENGSDKDTDSCYDSPTDIGNHRYVDQTNCDNENNEIKKLETIDEEEEGKSIFDDAFDDIIDEVEDKPEVEESSQNLERFVFEPTNDINLQNYDNNDSISEIISERRIFQPSNFDREATIKALVIQACRKIKAPIPVQYKPRRERIKRPRQQRIETDVPPVKRKRAAPHEAKREIDLIMSSYYAHMENDILNKISEHVKLVVGTRLDDNSNVTSDDPVEANNSTQGQGIANNRDNSTIENIENNLGLEPSVVDGGDQSGDESLEVDPRFDEKTYDIKQLYVKINSTENVLNMFDIDDDPAIIDIIEKKIDEFSKEDSLQCEKEINKEAEQQIETDSESDEIPLSVIKNKIEENKIVLDNFVTNEMVPEFKYWLRHYTTDAFVKNVRMSHKFDIELQENFPRSFVFVMQECASVLGCSTFSLYKSVQNLEKHLVTKLNN